MKFLVAFFLIHPLYSLACRPDEIHIREQWIDSFTKDDGTSVSAHTRSEHCRLVGGNNYFQDSPSVDLKKFKGKVKPWKESEKKIFHGLLDKLPLWLRKYKLAKVFRASSHEGNNSNPALTYPDSKTIILFDSFFTAADNQSILLHEMSHIAIWDIEPQDLRTFFVSNGWTYPPGKPPTPPKKVIIPDSVTSPSEDFSNTVEIYYSDPKRLKEFNPKSFSLIEKIIKSMEKK